jgi:hypothetical protein
MEQLTKQQAIEFANGKKWEPMTAHERASFQLEQDRLCMSFSVFHEAVENSLGRPVWTHEFGLNRQGLIDELNGSKKAPSFEQICALLPAEKTVVVVA